MKIAIHERKGSFSDRWIDYCKKNNISYKPVNAYDSNIIEQIRDCDCFMWHFSHVLHDDMLFAKQLLYSLQMAGKKVFPDFNTGWHFDDKLGQKYLLESLDAPFVHTEAFYDRQSALKWIATTNYPKVFKLRNGAGASNVHLIYNKKEAIKLCNKAFGKGFRANDSLGKLKEIWRKYKLNEVPFKGVVYYSFEYVKSLFKTPSFPNEKGYFYVQDFIPNNEFDIRVIVVGDKAFAIKRLVRKNDFRASGSGFLIYDKEQIDERCIKIAFDFNKRMRSQNLAIDFVFSENNPLMIELSYGYLVAGYDKCEGYWSEDMIWHKGPFNPYGWMINNLIIA